MADIFLCYRSSDDAYAAALLDEKLAHIFGAAAVFRDSRSITPGENYSEAIFQALGNCKAMLVVVGSTWMDHLRSCVDSPEGDWVRVEVAKALKSSATVIPVLLRGAPRLDRHSLPSDIADLAEKQYLTFDHRNLTADTDRLITTLREISRPRASHRIGVASLWGVGRLGAKYSMDSG